MTRKLGLWRAVAIVVAAFLVATDRGVADEPGKGAKAVASPSNPDSKPKSVSELSSIGASANHRAYRRIVEALSKPATFEFANAPLAEVVTTLESELGERLYIDKRGLHDAGIDAETLRITFRKGPISRRAALELILRDNDLAWFVKHEVLWITTPDVAGQHLDTRVYDLSERDEYGEYVHGDTESLIELLTSSLAPTTWDAVGGSGNIKEYQTANMFVLVITQTQPVHEQIERLFADLRAAQRETKPGTATKKPQARRALPFDEDVETTEEPPLAPDTKRDAVVHGANDMAFDLYRKLTADNNRNCFYSPHSIAVALSMLRAGATGETGNEIAKALHFDGDPEGLLAGYGSLRTALRGNVERRGYELRVANRLWANPGFNVEDKFAEVLRTHYGGEIGLADFGTNPSGARQAINAWVADHTADRIRELIQPDMIQPDTRTMLVNAVYFKGTWSEPFEEKDTKREPFTAVDGRRRIPTMFLHTDLPYAELAADGVRAVALRYGEKFTAGRAAMIVLLPPDSPEGLAALETSLSAEYVEKLVAQLKATDVQLHLPKFTFHDTLDLAEPLAGLGIRRAFDIDRAEFGGINTEEPRIYISGATHQAFIRVDEKGTEAAAATAFAGGAGGFSEPPKPIVFRVNRPFVLLIRDDRTKSILFAGRMLSPPDEKSADAREASSP